MTLEQQTKALAALIAQQPNAIELRRLFEQTYLENRLARVEDKLKTARRICDCPKLSEL